MDKNQALALIRSLSKPLPVGAPATGFCQEDAAVQAIMSLSQPQGTMNEATEPWADFHGDLPDYDHPLRCVFESGVQYAVQLLAKELGVDDYEICDGTEEFDGDLMGTMMNIIMAAMPKDEHGDPLHPSEVCERAALASAGVAGLVSALSKLVDEFGCSLELLERVGPSLTCADGEFVHSSVLSERAEILAEGKAALSSFREQKA